MSRNKIEKEMAKCLLVLKKSETYLAESEEIIDGLSSDLPEEEEEWWNKEVKQINNIK